MAEIPSLRPLRPVPDELGLYFRAGYNDHRDLAAAIAAGKRKFLGIVFEAHRVERHRELIDSAEKAKLECILDPCTQPSATPGGHSSSFAGLPWCSDKPHRRSDFQGQALKEKAAQIASFAIEHGFSQVMAPTHYLIRGSDPWHQIDIEATQQLRHALDSAQRRDIGVIYPFTTSYAVFRHEDERLQLLEGLDDLPINSVWIRVDPFGSDSTGTAVRNFVEASSDFHRFGVPVIGDQIGGLVGLSLLATSAIGGVSHGVTLKERFDATNWRRPKSGNGFMPAHRVYFPALDLYFDVGRSRRIFDGSDRLKGHFGCSDPTCCPRGVIDMLENPGNHFLTQRMRQVDALATIPESLRLRQCLEQFVRPTADAVVRFASSRSLNEEEKNRMERHRKRLDLLRIALEDLIGSFTPKTISARPVARIVRENRVSR
ncbi:MAG: hypothetical protein WBO23_03365 [Burkholderiales bacterium]